MTQPQSSLCYYCDGDGCKNCHDTGVNNIRTIKPHTHKMNEHELPDDIKVLDKLYQSPEDRIHELELSLECSHKNVLRLIDDNQKLTFKYNNLLQRISESDKPNNY